MSIWPLHGGGGGRTYEAYICVLVIIISNKGLTLHFVGLLRLRRATYAITTYTTYNYNNQHTDTGRDIIRLQYSNIVIVTSSSLSSSVRHSYLSVLSASYS